jgi:hypothetical protein
MSTGNQVQLAAASAELADYLAARKEVLVLQWVVNARRSRSIPTEGLTGLEMIDHVPRIVDAIVAALREQRSDEAMERVQEAASRHTIVRWVQRYDLRAVLREVSLLRAEFILHIHAFHDGNPHLGADARLAGSKTVHRILDDVVLDGTDTYLKLGEHANAS